MQNACRACRVDPNPSPLLHDEQIVCRGRIHNQVPGRIHIEVDRAVQSPVAQSKSRRGAVDLQLRDWCDGCDADVAAYYHIPGASVRCDITAPKREAASET